MKKKLFLLLALSAMLICLLAVSVSAVEIDGVNYTLTKGEDGAENTAQIANHKNKKFQKTEIFIPEYIEYEGERYYVTSLANYTFELTNVTRIEFASNSRITNIPNGFAKYCSDLEYVKLHESIRGIGAEAFIGCTKMKLDSNVLPSALCEEIGTYAFKNCQALEPVLVFPEGYTSFTTDSGLQSTPVTTLVFRGVMTNVHMRYFGKLDVYFANNSVSDLNGNFVATQIIDNKLYYTMVPAEKINGNNYTAVTGNSLTIQSFSSTGVNSGAGSYTDANGDKIAPVNAGQDKLYFCKDNKMVYLVRNSNTTGGWTAFFAPFDTSAQDTANKRNPHIASKPEIEENGCYKTVKCLACHEILSQEPSADALGHKPGEIKDVSYEIGYTLAGKITYICSECSIEFVSKEGAPALVESLGYSASVFGSSCAMVQGFKLNKGAIADYQKYHSQDFSLGYIAMVNNTDGAIAPNLTDEKIFVGSLNMKNDYVDIVVSGISAENADKKIVFCIYATDNGAVYFLENGITSEAVNGVSYNEILNSQG